MGIFSKYTRAHKVDELPTTNIDKEALYIVSEAKSDTFMIAVRGINNDHWRILERLQLGERSDTAAPGDHTHPELHTHSNKSTLDGITPIRVSGWDDVADMFIADKLMYSGFENAQYASTVAPDASILAMNPNKSVGLISIGEFNLGDLQTIIDDYIANNPFSIFQVALDGSSVGNNVLISSIDDLSLNSKSDETVVGIVGSSTAFEITGNRAIVKTPTYGRGIEYDADYSSTFVNRSLVDKGYVDKAISEIPNTNNDNKWFIGSKANPLDTPTIVIDTQGLMQGQEIIITYERAGQAELPLIVSSRPDVKIELYSINNSVNFEGGGVMNRIYLHLTDVITDDTYQFDITAGKIDTYTNV